MWPEPGGHSDKLGNRYEGRWVVKQLLLLLMERVRSVTLEAVGDDENGVDLWVEQSDGVRVAYQCKIGNGPKAEWSIADLRRRGVLEKAAFQLARSEAHEFGFVSAAQPVRLKGLAESARDSAGDPEAFFRYQVEALGEERVRAFREFCSAIGRDPDAAAAAREEAFELLRRFRFHHFANDWETLEDLRSWASICIAAPPDTVISTLADYALERLRQPIVASDLVAEFRRLGIQIRRFGADDRVALRVEELRQEFLDSIEPKLAAGRLIERIEADALVSRLIAHDQPAVVVHGAAGHGKSGVLYQTVLRLEDVGVPCLPLRLDRRPPRRSAKGYGHDLDLPDSAAVCLAELAGHRPAVLVLDQLDALRWTSAHASEGFEVCKELLRQVYSLRAAGHRIAVVLSCRTFDLDHDPQLRDWLKDSPARRLERIEVTPLPESAVKTVAGRWVDPDRLGRRTVTLLSAVHNLAMWAELASRGRIAPAFDSATQLMRAFWADRRDALEELGFDVAERETVLDQIVADMERSGSLAAPARLMERHGRLSKALQSLGIVSVSGTSVSFGHQSYFDFLVADRVVAGLDASGKTVLGWLGGRDRQSIFRREQLRQVLSLLADERPDEFVAAARELLNAETEGVRFHIRQLVLETIGGIRPEREISVLVMDLARSGRWRDQLLRHAIWRNPEWVENLAERGLLEEWIASGDRPREDIALWLLGSVCARSGDLVARVCLPLLERGGDWPSRIEGVIDRADLAGQPDSLFELRLRCLAAGATPMYVAWKPLAEARPERALRLFAALLTRYPRRDRVGPEGDLRLSDPDAVRALVSAARRRASLCWRLLPPHLGRLVRLIRRRHRKLVSGVPGSVGRQLGRRIRVPAALGQALTAAARSLACRRPELFFEVADRYSQVRSKTFRRILTAGFASLPTAYADAALRWLIEDPRRLRCGSGLRLPRWSPALRLIRRMSPHCSEAVFGEVERHLLAYRDPEEKRKARWWLREARSGWFRNQFLAGQYHLLPGLCPKRRSRETIGRIGVLECKFAEYGREAFVRPKGHSGLVGSTIGYGRAGRMGDAAWLRLITNPNVRRRDGRWRRRNGDGFMESSVEQFSSDLRMAAKREPERFARLALRFPPQVAPDYFGAVLDAATDTQPPSEVPEEERTGWKPASPSSVEALLGRWSGDDAATARSYCWVVERRADVRPSETVLKRLEDLASHPDPKPGQLNFRCDHAASACSVDDLEQNTINCVRGLVACAVESILFHEPDLLPRLRPLCERLLSDPHPVVRTAAVGICLPVWNVDRGLSVNWLLCAAAADERVAACRDALELYNFAFPEFDDRLAPLIRKMAGSARDDVARAGAAQMAARHIFFGLFDGDLSSCRSGSVPQRLGVSKVLARLIADRRYFARCRALLEPFFDDPDETVRSGASRMLWSGLSPRDDEVRDLLVSYSRSAAFRDDPSGLTHLLTEWKGSLLPFSEIVLSACDEFVAAAGGRRGDVSPRFTAADHRLMPLLVRLYEQAASPADSDIRGRCLDVFDELLELGTGSARTALTTLEA